MSSYNKAEVRDALASMLPSDNIISDAYLTAYTSFKIGGPADVFVKVEDKNELCNVINYLKNTDAPFMIIGNGTNLLVSDKGYRGVVVKLDGVFKEAIVKGDEITVGAGAMLINVCKEALNADLSGLEFAYGIPGSVGGAVYMNAGAYGGEMKDVIVSVEALDEEGEIITLTKDELELGYRSSICKKRNIIVLEAKLKMQKADHEAIKAKMEEHMSARRDKQPINMPSAGSTFKRPEGYFAGKLISEAGLSGFSVGRAQVSPKHNGFVVNTGGATAKDVCDLIEAVKDKVYQTSGVMLEEEVIFVGEK